MVVHFGAADFIGDVEKAVVLDGPRVKHGKLFLYTHLPQLYGELLFSPTLPLDSQMLLVVSCQHLVCSTKT